MSKKVLSQAMNKVIASTSQSTKRRKDFGNSATGKSDINSAQVDSELIGPVDGHRFILEWLSKTHHSFEHNEALKKVKPERGKWFIISSGFEAWTKDGPAFLWLHGVPKCYFVHYLCWTQYPSKARDSWKRKDNLVVSRVFPIFKIVAECKVQRSSSI